MSFDEQMGIGQLQLWMEKLPSVLVAYSGGVDSALVMAAAHLTLGKRALACIGVSPSYPERELTQARELAERFGAAYRLVETQEHLDPRYVENAGNRCYFCKTELYDRLTRIAVAEGWGVVLDGTNADDLGEHRPGRMAAQEHAVRSPLAELGFTTEAIRAMARRMDLPVWDKPAMACLASRVPHGVAVAPELLQRIEHAEDVLAGLGFTQFRVRHHGDVARIELPLADMQRALNHRESIERGIRTHGYKYVCLDLAGFRSGSTAGVGDEAPTPAPHILGRGLA